MSKPNILLIVSDDHGYGDIGCRGVNADVHTPNLDRLVDSGMNFNQAYVSAPICSPSRAGMITGAHQQRWGARWFDSSNFAPESYQTLPQVMKQAGYQTGYFGKIHYGEADNYGSHSCPDQHGFDESFYGIAALSMGRLHYLHHGESWVEEFGQEKANVHGVQPMVENGKKVGCDEHLTGEFARRAINFMATGSQLDSPDDGQAADSSKCGCQCSSTTEEKPFFCMVAFNAVHNFTWQLPEYKLNEKGLPTHPDFDPETSEYLDWYDGAVQPNLDHGREYYLGQLELMDDAVGRMLDYLEESGQRENTIVVYLTDNGGSHCNYGDNTPLAGNKYTLYEGGVRVPFVVSWPGQIEAGSNSSALVSSLDLMPTFAALGGAKLPNQPIDGIDITPVLRGEQKQAHDALYFDNEFQWSIRTPEWKLRWADGSSNKAKALHKVEHTDIGDGLSLVPIGQSVDEGEAASVADQHPEIVADLRARFEAWQATMGKDCPGSK